MEYLSLDFSFGISRALVEEMTMLFGSDRVSGLGALKIITLLPFRPTTFGLLLTFV